MVIKCLKYFENYRSVAEKKNREQILFKNEGYRCGSGRVVTGFQFLKDKKRKKINKKKYCNAYKVKHSKLICRVINVIAVKSSHSIPAHSQNWGRTSKCYRILGCTEKEVWRPGTTGLKNNGSWSLEVTAEMNSLLQSSTVLKLTC